MASSSGYTVLTINEILKREIQFVSNYEHFSTCFLDQQFLSALSQIKHQIAHKKDKITIINWSCDIKFHDSLVRALAQCISEKTEEKDDLMESKYSTAKLLYSICRTWSNYSLVFCNCFFQSSGLKVAFTYLKDEYLRENLNNINMFTLVRSIIGCLVNLSKLYAVFKNEWKEENSTQVILDLSSDFENQDAQMACHIVLAKTAEEDEISKFPNLIKIIPNIILIVNKIAVNLETNKNISRTYLQVNEQTTEHVSQISISNTLWHLIELLDALYSMAVNDSIKETIYFEYKMNECLRKLIFFGNQAEISHAVRLLWQLCFNSKIAQSVFTDSDLIKSIEANSSNSDNSENLRANCKGCMWIINGKNDAHLSEEIKELESVKCDLKIINHIMISYNRDSRDLCLKIKQDLEKIGQKVWIDVENIHGSSLEAMAKAVENSKCVLMCMTEKYKQSTNCRAEAEYAFQLNKPIIPLIMQKNYKPNGWLGIILGSKIFINFTKYDYDECLRRIKHEISTIFKIKESHLQNIPQINPQINSEDDTEKWSEIKVSEWFSEKNINSIVCENLLPCDGQTLKQLFEIMQNAPEFFYSSISSERKVSLRDIAYFTRELKKLFK